MDCSSFSSSSVRVRLRWAMALLVAIMLLGRDMASVVVVEGLWFGRIVNTADGASGSLGAGQ